MKFTLHPFQQETVNYATAFLLEGVRGSRLLIASPTGTGKGVMESAMLSVMRPITDTWLTTPRVEILVSLLDKSGIDVSQMGEAEVLRTGWDMGITTPIRLRNKLLAGDGPNVSHLIIDEAHHDSAETYEQLHALCGYVPTVGLTATPYRGTPRGTAKFREVWGEAEWAINLNEAVAHGYVAFPDCHVRPLLDDDVCNVANGDFAVSSVNKETLSRIDALADLVGLWATGGIERPSMVSIPGTESGATLQSVCASRGIPVELVTGDTSATERKRIFADCVECRSILIQINVVSEGVDLPIRRLLDASPTLSPVRWLQQVGRITRPVRPGERPPVYVCTNRNLLRHAYLMEGMLPRSVILDAQKAFPTSNARSAAGRVIGLEAVGRLKPAVLPLASGLEGYLYAMSAVEDNRVVQYAVIVHPEEPDPVWARRTNERGEDGQTVAYGRWQPCSPPADVTGFASLAPASVSEKQLNWWKRSARRHGLDHTVEPNRKQFAALPVLADLGARLR